MSDPIAGLFYEVFDSKAFAEDLRNKNRVVAVDVNHDPYGIPLAVRKNGGGTLTLSTDDDFLIGEYQLPKSRADIREAMDRGDMDGTSIAFVPVDEDWTGRHNGLPVRTITRATLHRLTLCYEPAYPDSSADKRTLSFRSIRDEDLKLEDYQELINKHMQSKPAPDADLQKRNLILQRLKYFSMRG
jgi:HK97 family phage prohead protease